MPWLSRSESQRDVPAYIAELDRTIAASVELVNSLLARLEQLVQDPKAPYAEAGWFTDQFGDGITEKKDKKEKKQTLLNKVIAARK